jgi:protease II
MNAGHGGKSGRDGAIEEIAIDYAFALKISKKFKFLILKNLKLIPK